MIKKMMEPYYKQYKKISGNMICRAAQALTWGSSSYKVRVYTTFLAGALAGATVDTRSHPRQPPNRSNSFATNCDLGLAA